MSFPGVVDVDQPPVREVFIPRQMAGRGKVIANVERIEVHQINPKIRPASRARIFLVIVRLR